MRLAPPPLQIGDRDGFKGTDIFGYEKFGTDLAQLVEALEGPSVIALDGDWGSGKTVFAKQWAGVLRQRGSAVIYLDAFAVDTGEDPLLDIASQLFVAAPEGEARADFARTAVNLGQRLWPLIAGTGLRIATGGLVGEGELRVVGSSLAEAKRALAADGQQLSAAFYSRVQGASDRATALADFRESLTMLARKLRENAIHLADVVSDSSKPRPVVMVIDELDRCKPTYALRLLENLKHVFSIENMCFVLVTNREQLGDVVSREYGVSRRKEYLEKFIHATFRLPTDVSSRGHSVRGRYVAHMYESVSSPESTPLVPETLIDLSNALGMSLRTIEKVTVNVSMCLEGRVMWKFGVTGTRSPIIPVSICAIRVLEPGHYAKLRSSEWSADDIVKYLRVNTWPIDEQAKAEVLEMFGRYFPASICRGRGSRGEETVGTNCWLLRSS